MQHPRSENLGKNYRLEKIGAGTFGTVHVSRSVSGGPVAVKQIEITSESSTAVADEMDCHNILRAKSGHPNVLPCIKIFVEPPVAAMMMEAGALDLARLQKAVAFSLPTQVAIGYATDITHGLSYVHACHVIHRDLKPSNIIMCYCPFIPGKLVPKIADFGCSRLVKARPLQTAGFCTAWYRAPEVFEGVILGRPGGLTAGVGSAAPGVDSAAGSPRDESLQADGEGAESSLARYDYAADTWSLGCILGEFLHGKILFPHAASTDLGVLGTIAARIGPPPSDVLTVIGCPPEALAAAGQVLLVTSRFVVLAC